MHGSIQPWGEVMAERETASTAEIAQRVVYWRKRRGLTRQLFADRVGRSVSWVDMIQRGDRQLDRLSVLEQIAGVLEISVYALIDRDAADRAAACVDEVEVRAIRQALGRYPSLSAGHGQPATIAAVRRQAAYLEHAWLSSRFAVVAQYLPRLLDDAQLAAHTAPEAERLDAHRALVAAYRLTSSMLLKFDANHIAWLAADRAMHTAIAADDLWSVARATRSVARAMTRNQQTPAAIAALLAMADRMRPDLAKNEGQLLSIYGMLYLAASIATAKQADAALADDMHHDAAAAAARMAPRYPAYYTHFGITNVLIHRVAALVRLYDAGRALEFATTIDPATIAALSPERRANYLLDLTDAHSRTGNYRRAAYLLHQAEQVAPEEVRCRPLAHGLLRSLLNHTTGEPARQVRAMATRAGVTA
jgi:transcriptional regulator with XRE-family HTH domain